MSTLTSRLGLTKPVDAEPQDVATLDVNFDRLDQSIGVILVNDGVTPPNSQLFDGAIVKEKTSGLVWVAQKNAGTGNFDQVNIVPGNKPFTDWVNVSPGAPWTQTYVGVPVFSMRRYNGWVEFSGSMYCATALPPTQVIIATNPTIAAAVGIGSTDNIRQTANLFVGGAVQSASLTFRTGGQGILSSGGPTNAILTLDGVRIRDTSVM